VVFLDGHLRRHELKALYGASDAVLANSGVEPFGLVGLEAMASGGLAFVGSTGEDYSLHGHDSISLQTSNPEEIAYYAMNFKKEPVAAARLRKAARTTATRFTWPEVLRRVLQPLLREIAIPLRVKPTLADSRDLIHVEPPVAEALAVAG
jgi:glycosyltransferase involved in cell wall biosynthesis